MDGTDRANRLHGVVLEYLVRGHFYMREGDETGKYRYGASWFRLRKLRKKWSREQLMGWIEEFKADMKQQLTDALDRIDNGDSSDDSGDD